MRSLILSVGAVCVLGLSACSSGGSGDKGDAKAGDGGGDVRGTEVARGDGGATTDARLDGLPTADGAQTDGAQTVDALDPNTVSVDAPLTPVDVPAVVFDSRPGDTAGNTGDGSTTSIDSATMADVTTANDDARADARDGSVYNADSTRDARFDRRPREAGADLPREVRPDVSSDRRRRDTAPRDARFDTLVVVPVDAPLDTPDPTPDADVDSGEEDAES